MRSLRHYFLSLSRTGRAIRKVASTPGLSLLILAGLLPTGATAAPLHGLGSAANQTMPLVAGLDITLSPGYFQRESLEQRDTSVKSDLRIAPGQREAVFITDPMRAPMAFSDVAPSWAADAPDGTTIQVELRTGTDGRNWSKWLPTDLEDIDMPQDSQTRTYASLVPVGQTDRVHRYIQSRVVLRTDRTGRTPVFKALYYTFIDAGVTPSQPRPRVIAQGTPSDVPKPSMVSRTEWGSPQGSSSPSWRPKYKRPTHIVVHHTATTNNDTDHAARVRAIWYYHAKTRGWGDVGYNYIVDPNGVIYEGRAGGDDVEAGHVYPFNVGTTGVGLLGNFRSVAPSAAAQAALIDLISWKVSQRGIDPLGVGPITGYTNCDSTITYVRPTISGHRDYTGTACGRVFNKTTCPGDRLHAMLPQIRTAIVSEQPPLRAVFTSHDTPGNLNPGATLNVKLGIRNSGSQTWPVNGQGAVSVGYRWLTPEGKPVVTGWREIKSPLAENVAFAESTSVTAQLNVPTNQGHYVLEWDMFRDGQGWFTEQGSRALRVDVVVGTGKGDALAPKSSVLPLPSYSNSPEIIVRWAGEDEAKGTGLVSYDIQYRIAPGGAWTGWQSATSALQATFDAEDSYTYEFRSRARDAAGNLEAWAERAQAYTTVDTRPPLLSIESPRSGAYVAPGPLVVTGRTDPGTFVAVNEVRAVEASGIFTGTIHAEGRDFVVHVTAADPAGNVSRLEVAVQAAERYIDVPRSHRAFIPVEELSRQGIIIGYQDGTFRPAAALTRGQFAKLLVKAYNWTMIKPQEARFSDVPVGDWAFPYVETAVARGAMTGFYDGNFRPGATISRGQVIKALVVASGWRTGLVTRSVFVDVPRTQRYAPFLAAMRARGLITGDEEGNFSPDNPASRSAAAEWVYLTLQHIREGYPVREPGEPNPTYR